VKYKKINTISGEHVDLAFTKLTNITYIRLAFVLVGFGQNIVRLMIRTWMKSFMLLKRC